MKLLVDRATVEDATLLTATTEYGTTRRYYETKGGALIRVDGLALNNYVWQIIDAQVGWDTVCPGFTLDESRIGSKRTKITIRRVLNTNRYDKTLWDVTHEAGD